MKLNTVLLGAAFSLLTVVNVNAADSCCSSKEIKRTKSETFISDKQTPWEDLGAGLQRKIMAYDGQVMQVQVKFEKGGVGTPHSHYHTQTTFVVSGKFEFTIGDKKYIVEQGDALYIEPDVVHGCVALEPGILLDCFAPMRESFLPKK